LVLFVKTSVVKIQHWQEFGAASRNRTGQVSWTPTLF
jgi:hypothetical protein